MALQYNRDEYDKKVPMHHTLLHTQLSAGLTLTTHHPANPISVANTQFHRDFLSVSPTPKHC